MSVVSKLKQYFIKKKIEVLSKKTSISEDGSSKKIKSIAIITTNDLSERYDFSDILIKKIQRRNPQIYSYRKYNKDDKKSYKHFSEKDFNWKGVIEDTSLQRFLDEPFDLLICFFERKNLFLEFVVRCSNASFKVGFSEVDTSLFNLEIACSVNERDLFFEEMKKYLHILNKL